MINFDFQVSWISCQGSRANIQFHTNVSRLSLNNMHLQAEAFSLAPSSFSSLSNRFSCRASYLTSLKMTESKESDEETKESGTTTLNRAARRREEAAAKKTSDGRPKVSTNPIPLLSDSDRKIITSHLHTDSIQICFDSREGAWNTTYTYIAPCKARIRFAHDTAKPFSPRPAPPRAGDDPSARRCAGEAGPEARGAEPARSAGRRVPHRARGAARPSAAPPRPPCLRPFAAPPPARRVLLSVGEAWTCGPPRDNYIHGKSRTDEDARVSRYASTCPGTEASDGYARARYMFPEIE